MTLIEDDRDRNDFFSRFLRRAKIRSPFDPKTENVSGDDAEALRLSKKNPLAEEESVEEDDAQGD